MNPTALPEPTSIALRAYTHPTHSPRGTSRPQHSSKRRAKRSAWSLVFDTETTVDTLQRLLFGYYRLYQGTGGQPGLGICAQEGLIYADDLDPADLETLTAYAATTEADTFPGKDPVLHLLSRSEFVERMVFGYGVKKQARIIGFNLPFDLTRIALNAGDARGKNYGGHSLQLWEHDGRDNQYRPRITITSIDSRRSLIGFTSTNDDKAKHNREPGRFLDCRTLAFALSDRATSLEGACEQFGIPFAKAPVSHGDITPTYIDYCRADVNATAQLAQALLEELSQHPVDIEPKRAFSPASIGKAYLEALGIPPILKRQPNFETWLLGAGTEAFYGGRADARIRKTPVPVIYTDFRSMYPTVNALVGNWELLTAHRIEAVESTRRIRAICAQPNLADRFFNPDAWADLATLVQIQPDGDILPVRGNYDPAETGFGIGVNPLTTSRPIWYALGDVIAATILTGRPPKILRAVTLTPVGQLDSLRSLKVRGQVEIDPRDRDLFRTLIEQRSQLRRRALDAEGDRTQRFLKVLANSTSYGVFAEFVSKSTPSPEKVEVETGEESWEAETSSPETPGKYCFPPLAACITAGARLMLALTEHEISRRGGCHAFCDTDSMAIVATRTGGETYGPGITALSWQQVDEIIARFDGLNPYDHSLSPGSILETEAENYTTNGERRQLWCWAVSAKRYALYLPAPDGGVEIIKESEHGLGHLLPPTPGWIRQAWEWVINTDNQHPCPEPAWLDQPALSRITISTPTMRHWFNDHNHERPYRDQVKPANFLVVAFPDRTTHPDAAPVASYPNGDISWFDLDWFDRRTSQPVTLTTARPDGHHGTTSRIRVQTFRDALALYVAHPEHKSLACDGTPVRRDTRGLLARRPVYGIWPPRRIGKEANRIEDQARGLIDNPDQILNDYTPDRADWEHLLRPALTRFTSSETALALGVNRRTTQRWSSTGASPMPSRTRRTAIAAWLIDRARHALPHGQQSSDPRVLLWRLAHTEARASQPKETP